MYTCMFIEHRERAVVELNLMKYLVFILLFIFTTHWFQGKLLLSSLGKGKSPVSFVQDEKTQRLVSKHAGSEIKNVKIIESDRPYGMMIGIPGKPQLVFSRGLYDNFSFEELEYVVLHESAHYKYFHTIKQLILLVSFLIVGTALLRFVRMNSWQSLLFAVLLAVGLGVSFLQVARRNEYEADRYAVDNISNVEGMIGATRNFEQYYGSGNKRNKILERIFYRSVPYEKRIEMAKAKIGKK